MLWESSGKSSNRRDNSNNKSKLTLTTIRYGIVDTMQKSFAFKNLLNKLKDLK